LPLLKFQPSYVYVHAEDFRRLTPTYMLSLVKVKVGKHRGCPPVIVRH